MPPQRNTATGSTAITGTGGLHHQPPSPPSLHVSNYIYGVVLLFFIVLHISKILDCTEAFISFGNKSHPWGMRIKSICQYSHVCCNRPQRILQKQSFRFMSVFVLTNMSCTALKMVILHLLTPCSACLRSWVITERKSQSKFYLIRYSNELC